MPDLLCMGEPMLEFNQQPAGPDGRRLYLEGHGGDTSNAAIAAARQGASVGYVGAIGADGPGESFLALWAREGVDASTVLRNPAAPTGIYLVTHDARGHHFTFYRSGSAAARYRPEDVPEAAIRAARILHLSGISQAISETACDAAFRAIAIAREAGVRISYDTNLRLRLWPAARAAAVIHAAIAMADIALPSLEDATALTGLTEPDAVADFYLRLCPLVVLKCGAAGCLVATREARARIPGHRVATVDATGAGDAFAGAFLARTLAGDAPEEAARYANAAAALATTGYGAVAPIPRAEAVRGLLGA
ncbi:sugar kinase [Roseomonas alkaliterrae]|uniref:2-dehydro-3-deoxygluconokinase n=1 Tax=Neoroseomonas alkaliterrae TaxID=1452450 RepID=A0A840Y5X4_9PROT|nr:sugar kinase [Neoroseomonas alkaliterrae]MBB5690012.1 2-dehydro-3-deoxygluconokinase [Neoroseomonas alkaliterrae]MBR0675510.1 sugar kinase [Neoroseomonas alkaliterrae]